MDTKYLYIDDEHSSAESYITAIETVNSSVTIEYQTPRKFEFQLQHFVERLNSFDGLILDWRLDQVANSDQERVTFRAGALAQELRSRGNEWAGGEDSGLKELPIVLWSTRERLDRSFYGDATSSDLFDRIHHKSDVVDDSSRVARELVCLSHGYSAISDRKNAPLKDVLGLTDKQASFIDIRFLTRFVGLEPVSVHDIARFILKSTVLTSGVLIDEATLAARLGVDTKSSPGWVSLREILRDSGGYCGPFEGAWPRWWWSIVQDDWWYSLPHKRRTSLISLDAAQRVNYLKNHFNLDLTPAEPIIPGYSSCFQTLCAVSGKPLDPIDGVLMTGNEHFPWLDPIYISVEAAVNRLFQLSNPPMILHPIEVDRVKMLRENRRSYG